MVTEITVGGILLHVLRLHYGEDRPTIIFLHDSLGCTVLWRDFPALLAEATQCNVLVYDRQGYGDSTPFAAGKQRDNGYLEAEADVLNLLLEQCGISNAILFGHSDGGSIALIAAAKYPGRIRAVITEGAHIFVEEITLEGIRAAKQAYTSTNLKEKLEKYHSNKTDALFHAWADTWLNPEFRSWNIEHFLPQVSCPVLVIQGDSDEYGTLAQVNGIINGVAGPATQLVPASAGHTPHKEAAALVLQHSTAFIKNLDT